MKTVRPAMFGIFMFALSGCADILGADFDRHSRKSNGDATRDADGVAPVTAPRDVRSSPDDGAAHADAPTFSDAAAAIDAGRTHDGSATGRDGPARGDGDPPDVMEPPVDGDIEDVDGHSSDGGNHDDSDAHSPDGGRPDGADPSSDGGGAMDSGDVLDAGSEPPPDAPPTTGVVGGFVSLGAPNQTSSAIEVRGHIISNAAVRGVTSKGVSIEGKIQ